MQLVPLFISLAVASSPRLTEMQPAPPSPSQTAVSSDGERHSEPLLHAVRSAEGSPPGGNAVTESFQTAKGKVTELTGNDEVSNSSSATRETASSVSTSSREVNDAVSSFAASGSTTAVPLSGEGDERVPSSAAAPESPRGCSNCTCVPYYRCGLPADDSFQSADPITITSSDESPCPHFLEILCKQPSEEPDPEIAGRLAEEDDLTTCGRRNPGGLGARLEGFQDREAQFGEFPWTAIILHDEIMAFDLVIKRFVCGGSLIDRQVVMTAAHCVRGKDVTKLTVRLGDWDTQNAKEILPHEDHRVAHVTRHGRFHRVNLRYDVALLFLEEPVVLKRHIRTLCLPQENEDFDFSLCVATGFGKDRFHGGRFQNIMKQVDLPVVPYRTCQSKLRGTRLGPWFRLHPSFTCAGGEAGVDTCTGDGGSGLACPSKEEPNKYVQVGIVAWGIGCSENGVPGVYASVPKLVNWVHREIAGYFGDARSSPGDAASSGGMPVM